MEIFKIQGRLVWLVDTFSLGMRKNGRVSTSSKNLASCKECAVYTAFADGRG